MQSNQSVLSESVRTKSNLAECKIYLIDNFDSFTYNLVNQLRPLVAELNIFRNDVPFETLCEIISNECEQKIIVISPGPGNPEMAGNTLRLIKTFKGKVPILGICLGHQAIVQSFSGKIGAAKNIIHGKASDIELATDEQAIFGNLKSPFRAARYHSLAATEISKDLKVIATADSEVMAVKHRHYKILGYQFHPESILTLHGVELLKNSLDWLTKP